MGPSAPRLAVALLLGLLSFSAICLAQNAAPPASNARDAVLEARLRFLGQDVVPFTSQKQNAVIVGVANALGGGILASDIILTVFSTFQSATATTGRRLLQQQPAFPGADIGLNITTSASLANSQEQTLSAATNQTYQLASTIGAQGLQTQQIILQSAEIRRIESSPPPAPSTESPPPPESSPPPSQSPPPAEESPAPPTAETAAPAPAPSASETSGVASASNGVSSQHDTSLSTGAIVGIVVGVVAIGVIVGLLAALMKRRNSSRYAQQGEVIDYFTSLDKNGERERAAGGVPVTVTTAEETPKRHRRQPSAPTDKVEVSREEGNDKVEV